ncbi:MAG: PstS family phosphate ABC transporter substrate-binding protein [Gaiellales bacterium]
MTRHRRRFVLFLGVLVLVATACGRESEESTAPASSGNLSGKVEVDGSSTVGPLVTAAAEQFQAEQPGVQATVGISGTGGGFERFCAGETDISNASRPIKDDEEAPICQQNGVQYTELQVATDALTVVTNKENDWVDCLTTDQLKKIWEPAAEGKITTWNQIDPSFPDEKLTLAGAGTDSGTFDYFTDEINGEEGASRADYQATEDDNTTVTFVGGEKGALGYFGFSYFEENQDTLNAVPIDSGNGCVTPSVDTAQAGEYTPLSRPLFVYVKNESLQRPEVKAFVQYMLDNAQSIAETARFVPLNDEQLAESRSRFEQASA